jgi:hypothetical protein
MVDGEPILSRKHMQEIIARLRAARYPTVPTDEALEIPEHWTEQDDQRLSEKSQQVMVRLREIEPHLSGGWTMPLGWFGAHLLRLEAAALQQPRQAASVGIRAAVERAASCAPDWMDEKIDAALSGKEGGDDG